MLKNEIKVKKMQGTVTSTRSLNLMNTKEFNHVG